jgi:hypothetical protein
MQVTQTRRIPMNWHFILLLLLFVSGYWNESHAQAVDPVKTAINAQDTQNAVPESAKGNASLAREDQARLIQDLLEMIKELRAENEALRLENEKERRKAADKLNVLEVRLAEIERKTPKLEADASSRIRLSQRPPRYDSNYSSIYIEPRGRVRDRDNRTPIARQ